MAIGKQGNHHHITSLMILSAGSRAPISVESCSAREPDKRAGEAQLHWHSTAHQIEDGNAAGQTDQGDEKRAGQDGNTTDTEYACMPWLFAWVADQAIGELLTEEAHQAWVRVVCPKTCASAPP